MANAEPVTEAPEYTIVSIRNCLLRSNCQIDKCPIAALLLLSFSMRSISQLRCSSLSHLALTGLSVSMKRQAIPSRVAGKPSQMNSHCHPLRPSAPSIPSKNAESGEPRKLATGIDTMNIAIKRAR